MKKKLIHFTCAILCCVISPLYAQTLEIHQISVGQGDAALVLIRDTAKMRTAFAANPNIVVPADRLKWLKLARDSNVNLVGTVKKALLIDAGKGAAQAKKISGYLTNMGVVKLDYSVLSHYHDDHFGGFKQLMTTYGFKPDKAYDRGRDKQLPGPPYKCRTDYIKTLTDKGVPRDSATVKGTEISLSSGTPTVVMTCVASNGYVLGRDPKRASIGTNDENDYSVGWLVQYGAFRFFTGGDLNGLLPNAVLETPMIDSIAARDKSVFTTTADIAMPKGHICSFKLNHHGGQESTNDYFLYKMSPSSAIVSCGYSGSYFHPRVPVIKSIDAKAGPVWDLTAWALANNLPNTIKHSYYTSMMDETDYLKAFPTYTKADSDIYENVGDPTKSDGIIGGDIVIIVQDSSISTESNYLVYWDGEKSDAVVTGAIRKPNKAGTEYIQCHKATTVNYISNK